MQRRLRLAINHNSTNMKKIILLTTICCLCLLMVFGQDTTLSSGGELAGNDGSASYSIGQVVCNTFTNNTGSVLQGVQLPYEISIDTGNEIAMHITLKCSVFPNPTSDLLFLKLGKSKVEKISYQLLSLNGKCMDNQILTNNEISISMANMNVGVYILNVLSNQQIIKTFKIIKN